VHKLAANLEERIEGLQRKIQRALDERHAVAAWADPVGDAGA
jgi:hypothetical protein